jgi:hypothetical protein
MAWPAAAPMPQAVTIPVLFLVGALAAGCRGAGGYVDAFVIRWDLSGQSPVGSSRKTGIVRPAASARGLYSAYGS